MKNLNSLKLATISLLMTWLLCTWSLVLLSYITSFSMVSIGTISTIVLAFCGAFFYWDIKRQEKEQKD